MTATSTFEARLTSLNGKTIQLAQYANETEDGQADTAEVVLYFTDGTKARLVQDDAQPIDVYVHGMPEEELHGRPR